MLEVCDEPFSQDFNETPEAALSALLGSKASYAEEGLCAVAPFHRAFISWPEHAGGADLASAVPEVERARVVDIREHLELPTDVLHERQSAEKGCPLRIGMRS